ncbi:zinc-dependent alcohol dehydrogenase family protein [Salinisphaera hydrothermalis]|uniref:zinc-dependent alcohol dehydrogenase family protein n=1 Tax=Salinisphaera hydrothermalis TaxID=563188 RepID=UPI00334156E0
MKAVVFESFQAPPHIQQLPTPDPEPHGVVIQIAASGLCRSDWHAWMGHDPDVALPHVPGHELAGTIAAVGKDVALWHVGDRVTVPFVGGCGACDECRAGQQQVCHDQFQPGFTHWGSFAEYTSIHHADLNLVRLPDAMDFTTAASLGCRFATSFRAVVDQGRVSGGDWVAVHGCGGVGLSAIMIANAVGANVVAIDIADDKLQHAQALGAVATVNARECADVAAAVVEHTRGGAHVSIDALGHPSTCFNSIMNLRRRGRHVQIGLMLGEHKRPPVPMDKIVAEEIELLGSHGMQAHRYSAMLDMVSAGKLSPARIVGRQITLEDACDALMAMDRHADVGATVITAF